MPDIKLNSRRKITWADIQQLVKNVDSYYKQYGIEDKAPLMLLKAIALIYQEHINKQPNKKINLNIEENRPKVLRSDVIRKYTNKEPRSDVFEVYRTDKGRINRKLKELISKKDKKTNRILNPKGIVLATATRKGEGETANYFVFIDPTIKPRKKTQFPMEDQLPMAMLTPNKILRNNFDKWKLHNYSADKSLKPHDLIQIETEINPMELDDEKLAYFFISCIFRRHNYHTWGKALKARPKIIWHVFNLLVQHFHRPFWRAAFILQYVEPPLFNRILAEFPKHILNNERINLVIITIVNKNVEKYLLENNDRELYAKELLREFSVYKYNFE